MPDPQDLVDPSGRPLIPEPKLIVIKADKETLAKLNPRMIAGLTQQTGCSVILLPMAADLMMGKVASNELESMHSACHAILHFPDLNFTEEELRTIYTLLHWAQSKLDFKSAGVEVSILKRIKKLITIA